MGEMNLNSATASDLTNAITDWTVTPQQTDGVGQQDETEYTIAKWQDYWGYFNTVPDLNSAILMKAVWNVGKGYEADARTKVILDHISGWGKDNFLDIMFNMEVIRRVAGDAFAEIMRDPDTGILINLKPLDPGSMKIVVDGKGIIKRYEQINKVPGKQPKEFKPKEIFHISNNRLADQIHGLSDIERVEKIIKADEENFENVKKVMKRQAKPMIMFKLDTDDTTKINTFVSKMDAATNKGENIYIPKDKDAVDFEVIQVNVSEMVMLWRDSLRNTFYRTIGLPQIVPGAGGQSTESESKVIYLAFEQIVERDQKFLEEQIWDQLNLRLDFISPVSLLQNMNVDTAKDGGMLGQQGIQPNEMTAGSGR